MSLGAVPYAGMFAITWAQAKSCLSILLAIPAIAFGRGVACRQFYVGSKDYIQNCNQVGLDYLEFSWHDRKFLREIAD